MKKTIAIAPYALLFFLILPVVSVRPGKAADAVKPAAKLCEDFKSPPRITFWSNNGMWKVNFAGPSDEKSAAGKRSFKIDVTWLDTSFDCWLPLPLHVLYPGNPTIGAKLLVERGAARLGHPYSTAESGRQGMIVNGRKLEGGDSAAQWQSWQADAAGRPVNNEPLDSAVVWARPDSDGRTVVYVDDIQIEGDVSQDVRAALAERLKKITDTQTAALSRQTAELESRLQRILNTADAEKPPITAPLLQQYAKRLDEYCQKARADTAASIGDVKKSPCVCKILQAQSDLSLLEDAEASRAALCSYAEKYPRIPFVAWIVDPLADRHHKVLPKRFPVPGVIGSRLSLSACAGEYEPASFAVHSPGGLQKLTVAAGDAKCGDRVVPAKQIDVRLVKCWWQAGVPIADLTHPTLAPEMLLYDPDFVRVDDVKRRNTVRDPDAPRDAERLLPVDIPADSVQQYWITVHVPDDALPGDYQGVIRLQWSAKDSPAAEEKPAETSLELPFCITVHPFRLEEPILQYGIYYLGNLNEENKPGIHNFNRSESQYLAEMRNLKAHGITHPICIQPPGLLLDRAIELRKQAGISVDPFYWHGYRPGAPKSAEDIESLKKEVRSFVKHFNTLGISRLYIYGIDEAVGDELKSQRQAFQAIHEAGAKVLVACYEGAYELVGDLLDLAVFSGPPNPAECEKWRAAGHQIFNYGNPQSGVEIPQVYRRNYGLALWKSGCDGAMDWAFTHSVGNVWDEYDHEKYRDIVFAYPTLERPIDTVQWEGNREGIDDVRYLSTLLKHIEAAKSRPNDVELAQKAEAWIATIDPDSNLNETRKQIVAWILRFGQTAANDASQTHPKEKSP